MIWICVAASRWISHLVKIYNFKDLGRTIKNVMERVEEFSSRMNFFSKTFPLYEFV